MYEFARQQERSAEVQKHLAGHFHLAESLFNFWVDQDRHTWTEPIPNQSANLALIQDVQALRLFRSVIEECRRCEGFSASILARSLFETVLSVAFLVKKDVRIFVEPLKPKGSPSSALPSKFIAKFRSKGKRRTRAHLLSRELRAELFLAFDFFQLLGAGMDSIGKYPGLHHEARRLRGSVAPQEIAAVEARIGPAWSYILRHSSTFAGLSVKDLASVLDKCFLRWYDTVYHFQSCAVHAFDVHKHLEITEDETLRGVQLSSDREVHQSLWSAIGMFLVNIQFLHENIGFGTSVDTGLHSLTRRFYRIAEQ